MGKNSRRKKKSVNAKRLRRTDKRSNEPAPIVFEYKEFNITDEAIEHPAVKKLPGSVRDEMDTFIEMIQSKPKKAIDRLLQLCNEYPSVPHFTNYLANAYSVSGDTEKAEKLIYESLQKFPDYLFAKIQCAELAIRNKEFSKIPGIFNHKYDLKSLYPMRDTFHVSEVIHFNGIIGCYFSAINEISSADACLQLIKELSPDSIWIKRIKKLKNTSSLLSRLFRK